MSPDGRSVPATARPEAPVRSKLNLLALPGVGAFLRSRLYPGVFQWPVSVLFLLIIFVAFLGIPRAGQNFATVVTWGLWWPLLPLTLLLFGRVWCAVCPLASSASLVNRLVQPKAVPGQWLRRYGVWIMALAFLGLTWADRMWRITASPRATGLLLMVLLGGAIALALLYQRRAWCRYMCPIGALTGLYAMTSFLQLRTKDRGKCAPCDKACYRGDQKTEGCPLYQFPSTMESNRNCNLCGQCLKTCPHGVLELRARVPGSEIWRLERPFVGEAFLAVLLLSLVYVQTVDMTAGWGSYMKWAMPTFGLSYGAVMTVTFAVSAALALGLYAAVALISRRWSSKGWWASFAIFGYAYIPLGLGGHLAHNLGHLVSEGPMAFQVALNQLGVPLAAFSGPLILGALTSRLMTIPVVLLGASLSLFALWRLSLRHREKSTLGVLAPHALLVILVTGLFVWTFLLPMNPVHSH